MGFFSKKKKSKEPNKDALVPMEQATIWEMGKYATKPNICLICEKYNTVCPYGTNQRAIACSEFAEKGSKVDGVAGVLCCPLCGSDEKTGTYGDRFLCKRCGRIFS